MARPKTVKTDTASIVEEKNSTVETENPATNEPDNEVTETPVVEEIQPVAETAEKANPKEDKKAKEKPINDDDKIVIKCAAYAGKSISLPTRTIELDEKGCCEVTGIEAKRLLTIPGYERAK